MTTVFEKGLLEHVQGLGLTERTWQGLAPEDTLPESEFIVLQTISAQGAREAGVLHPMVQADCYAPTIQRATVLAEKLVGALDLESFEADGMRYEGVRAERTGAIRVEDGTYKVPVQIYFSCMEA